TAELYDEIVPITANNFVSLANSGFYNNLIFHRVVAGFVIQDGCPNGTGTGGPGYTIQDEFSPLLHHNQAGILAMARTSAPNSAGSQYYFTLAPAPHLDGGYAIFGKIIAGLDTVLAIGQVPVGANNLPLTPVHIHQLRMLDLHVASAYPDPGETITGMAGEPLMLVVEAYANTAQISYNWFIDDVQQADQSSFIFEPVFTGAGAHTIRCNVASTDSIDFDIIWNLTLESTEISDLSPELNSPGMSCSPNPFSGSLGISYELKEPANVALDIFNLRGQRVYAFAPETKTAGLWQAIWDGRDRGGDICPAGIYYVRLKTGSSIQYRKISLLK
ncbi:MAG TPA: peptidylprolyl isomerase, partial [Candidatus Cloacimonadota bacterium]|nr:peptidylprolyl isomerase [Candidatus Cloacimonadota bacterium]